MQVLDAIRRETDLQITVALPRHIGTSILEQTRLAQRNSYCGGEAVIAHAYVIRLTRRVTLPAHFTIRLIHVAFPSFYANSITRDALTGNYQCKKVCRERDLFAGQVGTLQIEDGLRLFSLGRGELLRLFGHASALM